MGNKDMTNEEFKAKWYKPIPLIHALSAEFDGENIIVHQQLIEGYPAHRMIISPDVIEAFKAYDEALRKDIRRVMKVGEFEVKSE